MPKQRVEVVTTITLELTRDEAVWLHGIMQNPLFGELEDESTYDREMRKGFFEATDLRN